MEIDLEEQGKAVSVCFHATTRSPIGICAEPEYPINSGISLHSFYESERRTFLYNLQPSDVVIVFTDSKDEEAVRLACGDLCDAYDSLGCSDVFLVRENAHV